MSISTRQFSSRWFRCYDEAVDDPKIQTLGDRLGFFWFNCLCLASKHNGYLPSIKDIAWKLRKTESAVTSMVATLYEKELLDREGETFRPHNWAARQYQSDTSLTRVREYRQRLKDSGSNTTAYLKHKAEVFNRDGGRCVYCGDAENLCLDHMVPVILGGDDDPENLCAACKACNSGKSGRTPEQAGLKFVNSVTDECYKRTLSRLQINPVTVTNSAVTVTVTPPEQIRTDTDTEAEKKQHNAPNGACAEEPADAASADNRGMVRSIASAKRPRRSAKRSTEEIRQALGERLPWWEAFWKEFPCHNAKREAMDAFDRAVTTRELAEKIWRGARSYRAIIDADPTIRVKFGQGWINGERWDDESPLRPAPGRTPTANEARRNETIAVMELFDQIREAENVR